MHTPRLPSSSSFFFFFFFFFFISKVYKNKNVSFLHQFNSKKNITKPPEHIVNDILDVFDAAGLSILKDIKEKAAKVRYACD
jgi:hypothetical protein